MSVLLSKGRAFGPVLIVMLGLLGLWLGSHSKFWPGLIAFVGAFAGVAGISHLDLRATEEERRSGWKRIREHGKLRYVGRQVLRGWPVMFFLLALDISNTYQRGPRFLTTFFTLLV